MREQDEMRLGKHENDVTESSMIQDHAIEVIEHCSLDCSLELKTRVCRERIVLHMSLKPP